MTTCALARLPPPRAAVFATSRVASRRRCWRRAASTDPGAASSPTVNAPVRFDLDLSDDERGWLDARDEFRVLVLGKTGVGKSTMINALVDGNSPVGALEVGTTQCLRFENELNDAHAVSVWDAPGFFDVEGRTPAGVLRELSANVADYHAVVYAHVATDRRLRLEDEQSVDFVVRALGPALASRVVVALTYANEIPRPPRADDDDDDDARAAILATRAAQRRAPPLASWPAGVRNMAAACCAIAAMMVGTNVSNSSKRRSRRWKPHWPRMARRTGRAGSCGWRYRTRGNSAVALCVRLAATLFRIGSGTA